MEYEDESKYRALLIILGEGATLTRRRVSDKETTPWRLLAMGEQEVIFVPPRLVNRLMQERNVERMAGDPDVEHYRISRQGSRRCIPLHSERG